MLEQMQRSMLSRSSNNKTSQQRSFTKKLSTIENDSSTDNDDDITEFMDQNQRLAITLKNWSIIEDNDTVMMDEGGVATLISLAACDNDSVRKCVSYAFYHLSSRKYNRDDLIELGIVNGIVTIAMRPVSIRTAKLCALTLNNLTMCANQEATVAENGAILALGILMGIKGYRLLPVCVQALYNLTCCDFSSHYKPDTMRRIVKSLISLPQTNFDHITYSVKSIYNICRFSWVRARLVEDGALHLLMTYMEFIPNRTKKEEPTALVITCFRMLCETMSGRNEFIRKKIITNLHNILPFCSVSAALELVFMIFHLFEESIPTQQFESTVLIVTQIIADFEDTTLLQSCSACLYVFAEQQDRLSDSSIKKIFTAVFKLLDSADGLIQDYVVSTCEHIFFNPNIKTADDIKDILSKFIEVSSHIKDPRPVRALASCIARLSHEQLHLRVLKEQELLNPILKLLMDLVKTQKGDIAVQESVCVAICHIALSIKKLPGFIDIVMSDIMIELLAHEDKDLLRNAICSIRSMGSIGQCQDELISDEVFSRVACIIENYSHDEVLVRNSLAVLTVFSYNEESHPCLAVKDVMRVLFLLTDCKDIVARVLITTTLCNMSISHKARVIMLDKGLIEALGVLSGTTNEQIQELCATCLCNMTASVPLQKQLVSSGVLDLLMVIALVRSGHTHTKQLCARALLNLFTTTDVIPTLHDYDALRIFAGLSTINHIPTQVICARGFMTLTATEAWRKDLIEMPSILQALLNMINSPSEEAQLMTGIAVCNLLTCPTSQSTLIKYGGLDILNVLSISTVDDVKEAIVATLFSLINVPTIQQALIDESAISMLLYFLQDANDKVFSTSLNALYQMAKYPSYRAHMLETHCASVLVSLVIQGHRLTVIEKISQAQVHMFTERCTQILCLLSYTDIKCASLVEESKVMIAFHILYNKRLCNVRVGTYLAIMLRNLSLVSDLLISLVDSKCIALLGNILVEMFHHNTTQEILLVRRCLLPLLHNICKEVSLQPEVLRQGLMELLTVIMLNKIDIKEVDMSERKLSRVVLTATENFHIASTIQLVSQTVSCHSTLLESGCIRILHLLSSQININDDVKHEIACAICKLSATRNPAVKALLTQEGTSEILTPIAKTTLRSDTQKQCLLGLGYLSSASRINSGAVSSLLHIASGIGNGKDLSPADMLKLEKVGDEPGNNLRTARMTQRSNSSDGSKQTGSAGGSKLTPGCIPNINSSARTSGRVGSISDPTDKASEISWTAVDKSKYEYNIIFVPIETELAGTARAVSFPNLSLPKATTRSKSDTNERTAQLTVPPLPFKPMDKDVTEISLDTNFQAQREELEDDTTEVTDGFESNSGLQLDISILSDPTHGKKLRRSSLRRKKSINSTPSFRQMTSARSARSNITGSSDKSMGAIVRPGTQESSRKSSIASNQSRASTPVILTPIDQCKETNISQSNS